MSKIGPAVPQWNPSSSKNGPCLAHSAEHCIGQPPANSFELRQLCRRPSELGPRAVFPSGDDLRQASDFGSPPGRASPYSRSSISSIDSIFSHSPTTASLHSEPDDCTPAKIEPASRVPYGGLLACVADAVKRRVRGQKERMSKAEREVACEFLLPTHMDAIAIACRLGNFAISFRPAGEATLRCLAAGAPAKGHDILEKTIKPSSIAAAYPECAADLAAQFRQVGIEGYVAHWGKRGTGDAGIKGLYMAPDVVARAPKLALHLQKTNDGHWIYPIDVANLEGSLTLLKSTEGWQSLPFTGDYDAHDLIGFTGRAALMPSDSQEEARAFAAINTAVAACDSSRPVDRPHQMLIQHGPQMSYVAHMRDREKGRSLNSAVARPSFPVAMCDRGRWSLIYSADRLATFYAQRGLQLKASWVAGFPRRSRDAGGGLVSLRNGHAKPAR